MIEIALKSSRDYCEKWWRLLRKVVEIASNNGRGDAKKRLSWLQKGARVGVRGARDCLQKMALSGAMPTVFAP